MSPQETEVFLFISKSKKAILKGVRDLIFAKLGTGNPG
jgi:hypothetical protein|tara:strand:- start:63 stop:176 length:114 start_codon:yes stop_codon:yes gene_type:complete